VDCYNTKFTINLKHLVSGQKPGTLWTGYYAMFNGAKLAVSNMFGAWFEIERQGDKWQAIRLVHTELKVQGKALPGLNTKALIETGEPTNAELVERARSQSRASQHDPLPYQDPPQQPPNDLTPPSGDLGHYLLGGLENQNPRYRDNNDDLFSSNTACHGGGNPSNPYGDPWVENQNDRNNNGGWGGSRLEGDPPEYFEGDQGRTMDFLIAFKRFMIMNRDSAIAKDPYKKCAYFMGCIRGQKT
jgi:hypothetical protein